MIIVLYKLELDSNNRVHSSRLTPGESLGGLQNIVDLPSIPSKEMIAVELWAKNEDDNTELKRLSKLLKPYTANEHHGFFYNFTVLACGTSPMLRLVR